MRVLVASAATALCLALPAHADPVKLELSYRISEPQMAAKDRACLAALQDQVLPNFDGVTKVRLGAVPVMNFPDMPVAIYAGVEVSSQYGDASGALVCEYRPGKSAVQVVSIAFEGRGLAGFKKSPLRDLGPAERRATSYSTELFE